MKLKYTNCITSKFVYSGSDTCNPIRKLIFAKTHKTGSTTVQNIIFRYGMENRLKFVLPKSVWWFFSHYRSFKASEAIGYNSSLPSPLNDDVFAIHSVWNHFEIRKIIPKAAAVTILRDPISVFESAYSYFGNTPTVNKKYIFDWGKSDFTQRLTIQCRVRK